MTLEQFADQHEAQFDVVYSVFVLEHVHDPDAFAAACGRVLRPGGVLFALTPNLHHYFGLSTWAAGRLHVSNRLLRRLKGADVLPDHFPIEYRLNTITTLTRHLEQAGFGAVEFRCCDASQRFAWYLPRRLAWVARSYTRAVYAMHAPKIMGLLCIRATK
jgi:SAM-dependent methyltransferase